MHAPKMVAAETMARAVQYDPQFAMPARPRFLQELVLVPLPDGLLVEGTDEQQLLRGQATKTLLPRLMPLLDGTRTAEQLATELPGISAEHIQQAIALLYTRGLLEDTASDPALDPQQFDPNMLAFFRRHVDSTRVNRSALQAAERLHKAEVVIYTTGNESASESLMKQLRQAGIGTVTAGDFGSTPEFQQPHSRKLAVVLVSGTEENEALAQLDAQCALLGIPWLRVAVTPETQTADLGPYFERGETACYHCFRLADAKSERGTNAAISSADVTLHTKLWAAMLVAEVIYLLSRIAPSATGVHVKRYDLSDWSVQTLRFPKLPGCSHCRPVPGINPQQIHTAVIFEDAVRFPSQHLNDPKSHQMHYRASNLDLAKDSKRYPNAAKVALPAQAELMQVSGRTLDHLPGAELSKEASAQLQVEALASLLLFSGGIWHEEPPNAIKTVKPKRWAATGGNLGSAELYIAVHNVAGLEPGLYFYQVQEHQLARLSQGWGQAEVAAFMQQAADNPIDETPDALILSVGALHRVGSKYGAFAYRVINLDAGVALAQLQMMSSSLGLQTRLAQRWADDVIADQLQLQTPNEAVTGAVFIKGVSVTQQENER